MGMERMLYALMDTPDLMRELYAFIRDQSMRAVAWMEQENLLDTQQREPLCRRGELWLYGRTAHGAVTRPPAR